MNGRNDNWPQPPDDAIDIGSEHHIKYVVNNKGVKVGLLYWHPNKGGDSRTSSGCCGGVNFDVSEQKTKQARWQVEQVEPLTLSPSILCSCSDHGYIRGGVWIPA